MAEKSIKKNYFFNLTYQLLLIIVPLITTPYLSRVLMPEGVGIYSYTNSIVSYFILFASLGTATYGQRAIGYAQNDIQKRSQTFWEVFTFRTIASLFTLFLYLLIFTLIGGKNKIYFILLSVNILSLIPEIYWFFQGMEEFGKTVLTNSLCKIISVICIFLFVKNSGDLWIYILITVLTVFTSNLLMWAFLPKFICKVNKIKPFSGIKDIIWLFLPTISIQIYTVLDKSMIGWFSQTSLENGFYEQAEKAIKITLPIVTSLGAVMIARISNIYKNGDGEKIKNYIYNSYRFVWLMAIPLAIGVAAIADFFVPVFFGEGYQKCIILIQIFSPIIILIGLSNVTGLQYFVPTGKNVIYTLTVTVGAAVNIIANLFLIPNFFSVGACVASVIAEFFVTLTGFIYIFKTKSFKLTPVFAGSIKNLLAGVGMFVALYFIKKLFAVNLVSLLILIIIGAAIYFVTLLILRDEYLLKSFKRIAFHFKKN